jgi:hypothetical protein
MIALKINLENIQGNPVVVKYALIRKEKFKKEKGK